MILNILGTDYEFCVKSYESEPYFGKHSASGYCNSVAKQIVVCDLKTYPGFEDETPENLQICQREILRHEIIHAFLAESGLAENAIAPETSWALNEEMIDWFALQGPKIWSAWNAAGAV